MGPEDQHPWDREDEEIREAFAAKNAEIQRLKALITELCDALEFWPYWDAEDYEHCRPLIQRAREATRSTTAS